MTAGIIEGQILWGLPTTFWLDSRTTSKNKTQYVMIGVKNIDN